jgi:hypothetical protein
VLSGKVSKFSITSILCVFADSVSVAVSRVLQDYCQLKIEFELTFRCRRGLVWSFGLLSLFDGCNVDSFLPCFRQIDEYPYATLRADGWFHCDGLHRLGFPTLLRDVLHRFGYTGLPAYCGCPYRQFELGSCKVYVDIPAHPTDPTMTAWFTTARGDDLDNTLERAAHQALTESCEHHLPVLNDTALPYCPFGMRVTRCGVSAWPPSVTLSFQPTMRVGRLPHAMPIT